jgi:chorismate-pyruvate lyase
METSSKPDSSLLAGIERDGQNSFIYPLDGLYRYYGYQEPRFEKLPGDKIPQPYRDLLVHLNDMTPTLESFHQDKIWIRPEARYLEDNFYFREVVLYLESNRKPVEYGAIVIHLEHCPEDARDSILEARKPLGTLMSEYSIPHSSHPQGYFRILSDGLISRRLGVPESTLLYGRRNALQTPDGKTLAEIVEILPSAD